MARRFDNYFLLTLILGLVFGAMGMSLPLMTLFLEGLGASFSFISLILASTAAVSLVGRYLWGRLSDRWGRRKPFLIGGLAGLSIAYFWLSQTASPNLAWAARMGEALVAGAYFTTSLAMMGDLFAEQDLAGAGGKRGHRMGVYRGVGSLTFATGALISGRLADHLSINITFVLAGCLCGLAACTALALREPTPGLLPSQPPANGPNQATPASSRPARLPLAFLSGVLLWSASLAAVNSMSTNYLARLGYSKTAITSLWALSAVVEVPVMRWAGRFSDVFGRAPVLVFGSAGTTLALIGLATLATSLIALVVVQALRGISFASMVTTTMVYAAETGDEHTRGHTTGVYNAADGAGQLLGLLTGGTLAQARGFEFLFLVGIGGALLSTVCFLALPGARRMRRA